MYCKVFVSTKTPINHPFLFQTTTPTVATAAAVTVYTSALYKLTPCNDRHTYSDVIIT